MLAVIKPHSKPSFELSPHLPRYHMEASECLVCNALYPYSKLGRALEFWNGVGKRVCWETLC